MKLADKTVYPNIHTIEPKFYEGEPYGQQIDGDSGLTYKQWLVGMLASNPMVQQIVYSDTPLMGKTWDVTKTAKVIIQQADAIIAELEKE